MNRVLNKKNGEIPDYSQVNCYVPIHPQSNRLANPTDNDW
jgi:hypothetical protein